MGLTFLAFEVADLEASVERLVQSGGTVIESTRTMTHGCEMVFLSDPDGTRVELVHLPSSVG